MTINPKIIEIVDRINAAWPYNMTPAAIIEYQDGLNGLHPGALDKTIDDLKDVMNDRPSINKIKLAYDKHRPVTKKLNVQKPVSPIETAQAMVRQYTNRVMSCPAIDQIPTLAGKAKFRLHLSAVAFIQCQGATGGMAAGIAYSAIDACGYGTWGDDAQCRRMVRDWFDRGRQSGGPDGAYSAACLAYCKTVPEFQNVDGVRDAANRIKKIPVNNFEKEQQFEAMS